jgi:ABC-type multidrug transport system fused ATPase/permease subunit
MAGGFACIWIVLMAGIAIVALAAFALWIWMLIECLTKETDEGNNRLIWVLVIVFLHALGALLYLIIRRPERKRVLGR